MLKILCFPAAPGDEPPPRGVLRFRLVAHRGPELAGGRGRPRAPDPQLRVCAERGSQPRTAKCRQVTGM